MEIIKRDDIMTNLEEYKKLIKNATTKQEVDKISYKAFLEDDNALSFKKSLYDRVAELCIKRKGELS